MRKGLWIFLAMVSSAFGEVSNLRLLALGERPVINPGLGLAGAPIVRNLVPPLQVAVKNAKGAFEEIELRLKVYSEPIVVPGGVVEIPVFEGARRGGKEWAKVQLAETGNYLAVLVKDPNQKKPDWRKVKTFVFKDDGKSFPAGAMRIYNLSTKEVALKIGDQTASALKPGEILLKKGDFSDSVMTVAVKDQDGAWKKIFQNHPPQLKEGERFPVFVYDDENAKRSLGCKLFMSVDAVPQKN